MCSQSSMYTLEMRNKILSSLLLVCCTNMWTSCLVIPNQRMHPADTRLEEPQRFIQKVDHDIVRLKQRRLHLRQAAPESTGIFTIHKESTNQRKVYIISKDRNYFLKMNKSGHLSGTWDMNDKEAVFTIETRSVGVISIKADSTGRYICINSSGKITTRTKPQKKCLLRQYLEENFYHIFWSHKHSASKDGEDGWFLALNEHGRVKRPKKTRLGDNSTFFIVRNARG